MAGAFLRIALVATGVIAAFIVTTAGPGQTISVTSEAFQSAWSRVMAGINESHAQGYMMVAGAKVRDHRSCAPNCGNYGTDTRGGGKGKMEGAPPLSQRKIQGLWPQPERGGVTVEYGKKRYNYPCYGNAC
jgi:hypothetical protein